MQGLRHRKQHLVGVDFLHLIDPNHRQHILNKHNGVEHGCDGGVWVWCDNDDYGPAVPTTDYCGVPLRLY